MLKNASFFLFIVLITHTRTFFFFWSLVSITATQLNTTPIDFSSIHHPIHPSKLPFSSHIHIYILGLRNILQIRFSILFIALIHPTVQLKYSNYRFLINSKVRPGTMHHMILVIALLQRRNSKFQLHQSIEKRIL